MTKIALISKLLLNCNSICYGFQFLSIAVCDEDGGEFADSPTQIPATKNTAHFGNPCGSEELRRRMLN